MCICVKCSIAGPTERHRPFAEWLRHDWAGGRGGHRRIVGITLTLVAPSTHRHSLSFEEEVGMLL